ncbi:MAG: ribosomal protein S18-alanine N-acetyltransferase [Anaeroplasmataceae bacterium]|nr:ribosomal protein S18-alanine N-acetyltransferase [Anaeroplasmataceae bacterium]
MLRRYKKEDIDKIVSIEESVLHSTLGEDFYTLDLTNNLARHYVWEDQGNILGFISTTFDGIASEILNFGVALEYQHQGIGTKILDGMLEELLALGVESVILEVRSSNTNAQRFYQKFGFKEIRVRKNYYNNKEDALVYQKLFSSKVDIINLEANLFSKKNGLKYTSDFKERRCLNYYDLYDHRVEDLSFLSNETDIQIISNWYDEKIFFKFEVTKLALMHLSVPAYQNKAGTKEVMPITNWEEWQLASLEETLKYGKEYGSSYAKYVSSLNQDKSIVFGCYQNNKLVGWMRVLFFEKSIFILHVYTLKNYRKEGVCNSLFHSIFSYPTKNNYFDIYLNAVIDDLPFFIYRKMNFRQIDTIYELFSPNN